MRDIDRIFLQDYCRFGWLSHVLTATALAEGFRTDNSMKRKARNTIARLFTPDALDALGDGHDSFLSRLDKKFYAEAAAWRSVGGPRKDKRIQKVYLARLFAELMSTVEDIGALCWAVQHRNEPNGLFKGYLDSEVRQVGSLFQEVRATETDEAIIQLLQLPTIEAIRERLASEIPSTPLAALEAGHREFPAGLRQAAELYHARSLPGLAIHLSANGRWAPDEGPPLNSAECARVILEASPPGQPKQDQHGIFVRAFNKVKHRFAVVEAIDEMAHAPGNDWAVYSLDILVSQERVDDYVARIAAQSALGYNLAYSILRFNELGLLA